METFNVVLIFESVDEILWCDHSNEIFLGVLLHGTICFVRFEKMKFGISLKFLLWPLLRVIKWVNCTGSDRDHTNKN